MFGKCYRDARVLYGTLRNKKKTLKSATQP